MNNDNYQPKGPLAWFASNHVAANILMLLILVGGVMTMLNIRMEVFPEFESDYVQVQVPYLGASPEEVEEGVCRRVEEAVAGVDGVKEIRSTAAEGMGSISIEVEDYADTMEVLDDIKAEVDRIDTFPVETEKPIITDLTNRTEILSMFVYGEVPERILKALAEEIRDELTATDEISQVAVTGVRDYEISIEVSEETLRRYGLSFAQVSQAVGSSSLDLPGGSVKTAGGEILFRVKGQKYNQRDFEDVVVYTRPDGTKIYLHDLATVVDGFEDTDQSARFNGKPAAMIKVFRIGEQDALEIANRVKKYIDYKRPLLPAGVGLDFANDYSEILQSRLDLLTRNAKMGLILVFCSLLLFLDLRVAFWTMMGIPISFTGAFWVLPWLDVSINMISLFAFIVVLGIVVDDAIVVGENIFENHQKGMSGFQAAYAGIKEIWMPVTFAILTTVVAFSPLISVEGGMGKIMKVIPLVVISVLLISWLEALFILPAHLSGKKRSMFINVLFFWLVIPLWLLGKLIQVKDPLHSFQEFLRRRLEWFIHGPYGWFLKKVIRWRYVTVAFGLALLTAIAGFVAGGHIKLVFFPKIEADFIDVKLKMPQGTPVEQTAAISRRIEETGMAYLQELDEELRSRLTEEQVRDVLGEETSVKELSIMNNIGTYLGLNIVGGGPRGYVENTGSHLSNTYVELMNAENRDKLIPKDLRKTYSSTKIADEWSRRVGEIPGVNSLSFTASLFRIGEPINVELSHRNFDQLILSAERLKEILRNYEGVSDITDSFEPGKIELKLSLTEQGRTLNMTLGDLARQVRQGFYGDEVQRIQRGRDDIRVMVRYPEEDRRSIADIEQMRIRLADGTEVPFNTVAQVEIGRGYATINRADRRRVVQVTADVDQDVANANEINMQLASSVLPELQAEFPGLFFEFQGEQKEQQESMGSLKKNFVIALMGIFVLLAIQFRSYLQPFIIMSVIPFGLVGAVLGHILMGYDLTLLSMFGIVALTGVVVNDSLILIDLVNRSRGIDKDIDHVIYHSATRRFRPIILTTVTTFLGLTPIILEKSLQARFLIPMAISLGFGVLFATFITLVLVPALYRILEDVRAFINFLLGRKSEDEMTEEHHAAVADTMEESKQGPEREPVAVLNSLSNP